jgi:hypothetical protein
MLVTENGSFLPDGQSDSTNNPHFSPSANRKMIAAFVYGSAIRLLELPRKIIVMFGMERDPFDAAIDEILACAGGDVRRALRAVLVENIKLESELRQLYAVSEHGKPAKVRSLH